MSLLKKIRYINKYKDENPSGNSVRIAVLGNFTFIEFLKLLEYEIISKTKIIPKFYNSSYDAIWADLNCKRDDIISFNPEHILVMPLLCNMNHDLYYHTIDANNKLIASQYNDISRLVVNSIKNFSKNIKSQIHLLSFNYHNTSIDTFLNSDIVNSKIIDKLNTNIKLNLEGIDNLNYIDSNKLIHKIGYRNFFDIENNLNKRSSLSIQGCVELSKAFYRSIYKDDKVKCIVLDLDNTIWGGILLEDGIDNLQIGDSYPGNKYLMFQKFIESLYKLGIVLCIASKNDKDKVIKFLNNERNVLNYNYFTIAAINWNDKVHNIIKIRQKLNIRFNSMLFIDDSEFEIKNVQTRIKDIKTYKISCPIRAIDDVAQTYNFFTEKITDEDKTRNNNYDIKLTIDNLKENTTNDEFLRILNTNIKILKYNDNLSARILQLINKTNQFNFNPTSFNNSNELVKLMKKNYKIYAINVKDKFTDYGVVGVIFSELKGNEFVLRNFILSCRIIKREIEDEIFKIFENDILKNRIETFKVIYRKTDQNQLAQSFLDMNNFSLLIKEEQIHTYSKDISAISENTSSPYFKITYER